MVFELSNHGIGKHNYAGNRIMLSPLWKPPFKILSKNTVQQTSQLQTTTKPNKINKHETWKIYFTRILSFLNLPRVHYVPVPRLGTEYFAANDCCLWRITDGLITEFIVNILLHVVAFLVFSHHLRLIGNLHWPINIKKMWLISFSANSYPYRLIIGIFANYITK